MEDCFRSPPFVFQNFPFRMTKILIDNYGKKYYYLTHKKNRKRMIATAVSRFRGLPHISILIFLCAPVNSETMVTDLLKMIDLFLPYGLGSPSGDIQSNHMVLSC